MHGWGIGLLRTLPDCPVGRVPRMGYVAPHSPVAFAAATTSPASTDAELLVAPGFSSLGRLGGPSHRARGLAASPKQRSTPHGGRGFVRLHAGCSSAGTRWNITEASEALVGLRSSCCCRDLPSLALACSGAVGGLPVHLPRRPARSPANAGRTQPRPRAPRRSTAGWTRSRGSLARSGRLSRCRRGSPS